MNGEKIPQDLNASARISLNDALIRMKDCIVSMEKFSYQLDDFKSRFTGEFVDKMNAHDYRGKSSEIVGPPVGRLAQLIIRFEEMRERNAHCLIRLNEELG